MGIMREQAKKFAFHCLGLILGSITLIPLGLFLYFDANVWHIEGSIRLLLALVLAILLIAGTLGIIYITILFDYCYLFHRRWHRILKTEKLPHITFYWMRCEVCDGFWLTDNQQRPYVEKNIPHTSQEV